MVKVGDRIRLSSGKGPYRDGVVAAVTGSMVRVRWPSEEETTVIPAPGTLTVLASSGDQAPPAGRRERTATKNSTTPKKGATKKTTGAKKSTTSKKTATAKNVGIKKSTTPKTGATKKSTTPKTGATKKTTGAKRSSR